MPFEPFFDGIDQKIIKPVAASEGLAALRADNIFSTNVIIKDIWDQIWRARVVIADVTNRNANVNYELGLCHSLGVPTILISRRIEDLPFDYHHHRCIIYNTNEVGWDQKLREDLSKTLQFVLSRVEHDGDLLWPYDTQKVAIAPGASLVSTENPRDLFVQGTQSVLRRIGKAFGPAGTQFSVSVGNREPMPYKHGYSIVQGMRATNPLEGRGVREMQLVAQEVNTLVGDGTKIAVLIAQAMIEQGHEALKRGYLHGEVIEGIKKALDHSLEYLAWSAQGVIGERLEQVASSAAMDTSLGSLVSKAIECAGKDGVVTIENSTTTETSLEVVEGMQLDRGFLSDQFITNHDTREVVLENPYILVHERRLSSMRDLLPLLEQIAKMNEPLLLIAEDVEGEALATLIVNHVRGTLKVAAIKGPGMGDQRRAMLDDITTLTGAKLLSPDLGITLDNVLLTDLGRAKSVIINKDFTTIIEGAGDQKEVEARTRSLRAQIDVAASSYEREKLQERLARLVGGLAVVRIGGISEIEVIDKRYRSESAMHSATSAVKEGWLPGGGVTLLRASDALKRLSSENEAQSAGRLAVIQALEKPIHHLIENAHKSPTQAITEIRKHEEPTVGFNVNTMRVEDLAAAGVIDSAKMLRMALEIAFTHAKSVLQTEDWDLDVTQN